MGIPTETELTDAIVEATRRALIALRQSHPRHHFYYCSLITTGEAHAPTLVAWSREALADAVTAAGNDPSAEAELKWSYADSPFFGFGEQEYDEVRRLFAARPALDPDDPAGVEAEYELRLRAMERAMAQLDSEGLFGSGAQRDAIVVNAEVMPPDTTNVERARRLNPPSALTDWLAEAAEF